MANSRTLDRILGTMRIRKRLTEVSDESENRGRKKCKKDQKGWLVYFKCILSRGVDYDRLISLKSIVCSSAPQDHEKLYAHQ